jgi:thioredoxin-dependent peroxiredoxin
MPGTTGVPDHTRGRMRMGKNAGMSIRLSPGDRAPDFTLPDADGKPISLSDLLAAGKSLVLYAYPAAGTPGCTTQACDFRDSLSSLTGAGYTVAGISKDGVAKLAKFREDEHLTFPLLADPEKTTLQAYGAFGEKQNYGKTIQGVIRSTFVIGADGVVQHAFYNVRAAGHVLKLRKDLGID